MRKAFGRSLLFLVGLAVAGCAPATYRVAVNGYVGGTAPLALTPGAGFFVIENKAAQNPLLEQEIRAKINNLLEAHGYELAPFEKADYYLLFSYGIGQGQTVGVTMPDYYPSWGIGFGSGYPLSYSLLWPGYLPYMPYYPTTLYDKWLLINVIEGKVYREQRKFNTLWVGDARSRGPAADLRVVVNYLLLADFKEFGQNTGKAIKVEISEDDLGLKKLETVH